MSQTASDKPDFQPELSAALERFIDGLRRWQKKLFHGDDWYEAARLSIRQVRSEFRGSIGSVFDAARKGMVEPLFARFLDEINSITFISALEGPESKEGFDVEVTLVVDNDNPRACLDMFIEKFDRLHENYADVMTDPTDWEPYCEGVIENVGEIVGVVERLIEQARPASPASSMTSEVGAGNVNEDTNWAAVQRAAEKWVKENSSCPMMNKLQEAIKCNSKSTFRNAIKQSQFLQEQFACRFLKGADRTLSTLVTRKALCTAFISLVRTEAVDFDTRESFAQMRPEEFIVTEPKELVRLYDFYCKGEQHRDRPRIKRGHR